MVARSPAVNHGETEGDHVDEVVTVGSPDHRAVEVEGVTGRLYRARAGGMYDMHPVDAAALVRAGGFNVGIGPGLAAPGGHVCERCGRHNYLPTCGKCGS